MSEREREKEGGREGQREGGGGEGGRYRDEGVIDNDGII